MSISLFPIQLVLWLPMVFHSLVKLFSAASYCCRCCVKARDKLLGINLFASVIWFSFCSLHITEMFAIHFQGKWHKGYTCGELYRHVDRCWYNSQPKAPCCLSTSSNLSYTSEQRIFTEVRAGWPVRPPMLVLHVPPPK